MIRYLSYQLERVVPAYGAAGEKPRTRAVRSLTRGDSCNVCRFTLNNHWGTHVDCPAHFFRGGNRVSDYGADFWRFRRPQVVKIKARPGQIVSRKDLNADVRKGTDLLLLKSGWGRARGRNVYSTRNPGIDPELGLWLRRRFPSVRAIGLDWISLSSWQHRELGREAHRAFLDPSGAGHPVLVIEDMDLSADLSTLREVWVAPLRVVDLDSAPVTVLGVFKG